MSAWMDHLKKVMAENKGKSLKECMIIAKGSYKKQADGTVVKKAKKTKKTKSKTGKKVKKTKKGKKEKKVKKTRKMKKTRGRK